VLVHVPTPVIPHTSLDPFSRPADFLAVLDALAATSGRPLSDPAAFDDLGNEPAVAVKLVEAPEGPGILVVG